jgi:predicted MFS family arabinose efflux permease
MTAAFDDVRARKNAIVLAVGQALFGGMTTALVVTAGLIGSQLSPSAFWATMPQTMAIVGTALTTMPQSLLMRRIGRRNGFMAAAFIAAIGGVIGTIAIYQRSFELILLACFMIGIYQASSSYYRFAAADLASPAFRPKAISWVMTGGVAAALLGSLMVIGTTDLLAPVTYAGTWIAMSLLALAAVFVLSFVDSPVVQQASTDTGRPLGEIARQKNYIVATVVTMLSFGSMMLVMTATPVAMLGCGFTVQDSSWVIQWHALGMFVPSFFTGHLITRFGAGRIAAIGMLLLMTAAIAGLLGIKFSNFAIGLLLLGVGWNFGFIGGTTLLTSTYRPEERNKAQGLSDFVVFTATALASLGAGSLLATVGWDAVNIAVFPLAIAGLLALALLERKPAVAA